MAPNRLLRALALCAVAALWLGQPPPAAAQAGPAALAQARAKAAAANAAQQPSPAELEALITTLKDDAERQKLIARLELMLAAQRAEKKPPPAEQGLGSRVLSVLSDGVETVSHATVRGMRAVFDVGRLRDWVMGELARPEARQRWISVAWKVALTFALALLAEWLARLLLAKPYRVLEAPRDGAAWRRVLPLAGRTALDVLPVAAFMAAGYAVLTLVKAEESARLAALALVNAYLAAGLVLVVGRAALAPSAATLRLLPLADADANYLYIWLRRFAAVVIYGYVATETARLLGMPAVGAAALLKVVGLFVAMMALVFVLQNRHAVARWLRGSGEDRAGVRVARARLADIWHLLAIAYVIGMYAVWALAIKGGFEFMLQASVLSLLILAGVRLVLAGLNRLTRRVFALSDEMQRRFPELEARANRYLPILQRIGALVVWVVAAFALLESWGVDSFAWLETEAGRKFAAAVMTSAAVIIAATLAWELVSAWIERYLARESAVGGAAASARARTLLPLLRTTLLVLLVGFVALVVLSEFGVNIAPLLAGAGVIGLAIGFGAQTLVKDVITGVFILAEDQIAVGDVVKIGSHAGVVEKLSLRTLWLRGLDGNVHVIPFSEVNMVENMTKDFSRYVFEVGVAYREDTDQVVEVLKEIGAGLQADPDYRDLITEPLEVLGVDAFGDNAVVIKARFTTRPIQQWKVGREFNRRMKKRFDELGIEIPFPHRTLYFGVDKAGKAPAASVRIEGAAGDGNVGGRE